MTGRVSITVTDQIADVRLMRADKMNAIDPAMFADIGTAIDALADRMDVRCVVLSGEGKAFCAGLDMASMAAGGSGTGATRNHQGSILPQHVTWGWRQLPMPVIAAVLGVAFGGGFQIMSGADIVASIALGARFTLVGRAYLYGLMAGGQEGVERMIQILSGQISRTMRLLGVTSLEELTPAHVTQLERLTPRPRV